MGGGQRRGRGRREERREGFGSSLLAALWGDGEPTGDGNGGGGTFIWEGGGASMAGAMSTVAVCAKCGQGWGGGWLGLGECVEGTRPRRRELGDD